MSRIGPVAFILAALRVMPVGAYSVFDWLGAQTRVVVGEQAPAEERDAALRICRILNPAHPAAALLTDGWVAAHPKDAASFHLITVGTTTSNRVLRDHPSSWWRTPEWAAPAAFSVQGIYLFGIGDLRGESAGVVEPGRNPYAAADHEATEPRSETILTFMIACAGRHPDGVVAAVNALIDGMMLSGAIPDHRVPPRPEGPLELEPGMFEPPPAWVWLVREASLIGWHQVDRLMIDALARRGGHRPAGAWRLVVRGSSAPHALHTSLHRRNSEGEVLLCRMETPGHALTGLRRLMRTVGEIQEEHLGTDTVVAVHTPEGTIWGAAAGPFLAVESIPGEGGRSEVEAIIRAVP